MRETETKWKRRETEKANLLLYIVSFLRYLKTRASSTHLVAWESHCGKCSRLRSPSSKVIRAAWSLLYFWSVRSVILTLSWTDSHAQCETNYRNEEIYQVLCCFERRVAHTECSAEPECWWWALQMCRRFPITLLWPRTRIRDENRKNSRFFEKQQLVAAYKTICHKETETHRDGASANEVTEINELWSHSTLKI